MMPEKVMLYKDCYLLEELPFYFKLSWWQRFMFWLRGYVHLFEGTCPGWKGYLPFYMIRCKTHNVYYVTYPAGYEQRFICPFCLKR